MENRVKRKIILREDARDFLKYNYPEAFEIKEIPIRIKTDKPFIKLMHINKSYYDAIIEKLWFAYLWYFTVLLNSLDYDNKVDFIELTRKKVKPWMISVCKQKFIYMGMIKKEWNNFYVNPKIAIKWETINPNLKELFWITEI